MLQSNALSKEGLRFGPIPQSACHICVDMQRLFADGTEWSTPWMPRVLPNVVHIVERYPSRAIFTRFVPMREPGMGTGTWKRYYQRWASMTLTAIPSEMVELVPELSRFVPPAAVVDKKVYSPWFGGELHALLRQRGADTLVITGGETDVCVLATVMGAVDYGYRVVIVTDALCSSSDETHDALLALYHRRFSQQIETAPTDEIISEWRG